MCVKENGVLRNDRNPLREILNPVTLNQMAVMRSAENKRDLLSILSLFKYRHCRSYS
jgi:hypothetical protein